MDSKSCSDVESPPPSEQKEKREDDVAIDLSFEHKETYFPMPVGQQLAVQQSRAMQSQSDIDKWERFWALYPAQSNKAKAEVLWFSEGCHLIADEIISKLNDQIAKDKRFKDGYVWSICNYIVGRQWQNKILEVKKEKGHFDYNDTSWASSEYDDIFDKLD